MEEEHNKCYNTAHAKWATGESYYCLAGIIKLIKYNLQSVRLGLSYVDRATGTWQLEHGTWQPEHGTWQTEHESQNNKLK